MIPGIPGTPDHVPEALCSLPQKRPNPLRLMPGLWARWTGRGGGGVAPGGWVFEPDGNDTRLLYLHSSFPCSVSGSHNPVASTVGDDRKSYPRAIGLLGTVLVCGHG